MRFSPGRQFRLRMEIRRDTVNESWEHFPVNKVTFNYVDDDDENIKSTYF